MPLLMTKTTRNSEVRHGIFLLSMLLFFLFFLQLPSTTVAQRGQAPPADDDSEQFDTKNPFNPSMAIIMIIIVSIFFCFGCFCVYIRQCAERRMTRNFNPAATFWRMQVPHGLDPEVIKTFPIFQYKKVKGHKIGKRALECAVCLNEFQDDETLRLLPKCNHVFHPDCVDAWLAFHVTCPVCRANLVPRPGEASCAPVLAFEPSNSPCDTESIPPASGREDNDDQARVAQAPPVNTASPIQVPSHSCSPVSWSTGLNLPRSNSTGHSLVQPGTDFERFTLRLPEEVRLQLLNTPMKLKRTRSLPRMRSPKNGFKGGRGGMYERFSRDGRADRWGFCMTPPFITRGGLARSPIDGAAAPSPPTSLIKTAANRLLHGTDNNAGEKSFNRLRPNNQV